MCMHVALIRQLKVFFCNYCTESSAFFLKKKKKTNTFYTNCVQSGTRHKKAMLDPMIDNSYEDLCRSLYVVNTCVGFFFLLEVAALFADNTIEVAATVLRARHAGAGRNVLGAEVSAAVCQFVRMMLTQST